MSRILLVSNSWFLLLSLVFAQGAFGSPAADQKSVSKLTSRADEVAKAGICNYSAFQSIFMQDRVYVDGGLLYYIVNGTAGTQATTKLEYPTNLSYIDLNKPFDFSTQTPAEKLQFLTPVDSAQGRQALLFGALLGDDWSWLQYGGMRGGAATDGSSRSETESERFDFRKDPNNPTQAWLGDYRFGSSLTLPKDSVTNYVYAGAVARSPGDRKSWWFSGSRAKNWTEVIYGRTTAELTVGALSNYLITADFSSQQVPAFTNTSIDSSIAPRAGASMVFLPVGDKGILVVLGGVSVFDPVWMVGFGVRDKYTTDDLKAQATASQKFLHTIDVYDIADGKWYSQNTTGSVPTQPISAACAVAASADDKSSHNIYFYGGHGGLSYTSGDPGSQTNSKFYVLTLPYFRWIEVLNPSSGDVTGRSLHQCHRVQPNQMLVVGGHPTANNQVNSNSLSNCALYPGPGPAVVFDMNTCEVYNNGWDPTKKADYRVPDKVTAVIGGSGTGGATKKEPEGGWSDDGLQTLFSNPEAYTETVTPLWAYSPTSTVPMASGTATSPPAPSDSERGFPSYIPPLLGTLLGLFGIITVLSIILFILRRRKQKRDADAAPSETEGSTVRKNKQTWSWLLGVYGDEKPPRGAHQPLGHMRNYSDDLSGTATGTTLMYGPSSGLGSEANRESVISPISPITERSDPVMELQGKVIHEMPDTSLPQELAAGVSPREENSSRTSLKKEGKSVRYEDEQPPALGDEIQPQGISHPLGHRKMSSLDYPE
ncbi:hypothetical protein EV426DRAFT_710543 [Tirmania nivea]|nr:hypothetical protein EV426DRAFT_710543 [Tirmania nivea]